MVDSSVRAALKFDDQKNQKKVPKKKKDIRLALIGATGAVGSEIVEMARIDQDIQSLAIITRRIPDESKYGQLKWSQENFMPRLQVVVKENFKDMGEIAELLQGFNAFICCLGANPHKGKDQFLQVDYTYVVSFAEMAKELGAEYFAVMSSYGADESSMLLYYKTKGRMEEKLREMAFPQLAIFRPYFLMKRKKPKIGVVEKMRHYIPYFGKGSGIETAHMAQVVYFSTKEFMNRQIPGLSITHQFDYDIIQNVFDMYRTGNIPEFEDVDFEDSDDEEGEEEEEYGLEEMQEAVEKEHQEQAKGSKNSKKAPKAQPNPEKKVSTGQIQPGREQEGEEFQEEELKSVEEGDPQFFKKQSKVYEVDQKREELEQREEELNIQYYPAEVEKDEPSKDIDTSNFNELADEQV